MEDIIMKVKQQNVIKIEFTEVKVRINQNNCINSEIQFENEEDCNEVERILKNNMVINKMCDIDRTTNTSFTIIGCIIIYHSPSNNKLLFTLSL